MKNLLKTPPLLFAAIVLISCNPQGTSYKLTKWIFNKNLKAPTTIHIDYDFVLEKAYYQDGHVLSSNNGAVDFDYIDRFSQKEFSSYLRKNIRSKFKDEEMITIVPENEAEYILKVSRVILSENVQFVPTEGYNYQISHCDVELEASLYHSDGTLIDSAELETSENESLKEIVQEDGTIEYKVRSYSLSFNNLLRRIADKTESWTETELAKLFKKKAKASPENDALFSFGNQ